MESLFIIKGSLAGDSNCAQNIKQKPESILSKTNSSNHQIGIHCLNLYAL